MKAKIFPFQQFTRKGKVLNVKFGIDPTSDKLHLGHLIPLLNIKELKEEGHNIDIVLGTFTAQLGDPSEKDSMRPMLDKKTTTENADSIIKQVRRILGNDIRVHFNHVWFEELNCVDMIELLSKFTVKDLLSRDSFQKRIENGNPIGLHELVVPILQGIDSAKLRTDVEIGGTDQLFNFTITREIQKQLGQEPEVCFLSDIINGTDGRKMSKSFGNCIFINDTPVDVFGKTMSISDDTMKDWFKIFMEEPINESKPFEEKKKLASKITEIIWSPGAAEFALQNFESVVQNKEVPEIMPETHIKDIISIIVNTNNCSKSEARRLIRQDSVRVNGIKMNDETAMLNPGDIAKIGKRGFVKII
jgi:tyrosyl-tRNA synthetase